MPYCLFAALAAALVATPALASEPNTRLVECGTDNCLLVTGHRESAETGVRINGHAVRAAGGRSWRVSLPLATVRAWAEPFARTISVTHDGALVDAALPIGLMGHTDLASLVVSIR